MKPYTLKLIYCYACPISSHEGQTQSIKPNKRIGSSEGQGISLGQRFRVVGENDGKY